jgi:hypothetical protein
VAQVHAPSIARVRGSRPSAHWVKVRAP